MSDFEDLVENIQQQTNGNGAAHDDDTWVRKELLPTIGRFVKAQVRPLQQRIEELETRMVEFQYCGVWHEGTYKRGNFVTHDGSVWHCNVDTCTKPGTDPVAWTLAVKRGKDNAPRLPTQHSSRQPPVLHRTPQ